MRRTSIRVLCTAIFIFVIANMFFCQAYARIDLGPSGGYSGKKFVEPAEGKTWIIDEIRICGDKAVDSIQLGYHEFQNIKNTKQVLLGGPGGTHNCKQFTLGTKEEYIGIDELVTVEECISEISGSYGAWIDHLTITRIQKKYKKDGTSFDEKTESFTVGTRGPRSFKYEVPDGYKFGGFHGCHTSSWYIDAIGISLYQISVKR